MRRSGWVLPAIALAAWLAAVGWPALALPAVVLADSGDLTPVRDGGRLLARSTAWAASIAGLAAAVGWLPGRLLGSLVARRAGSPVAALLLAPICLPAYVVFYAWWQTWPADSALYAWAVEHEAIGRLRAATLGLGLVCWSWPIVAWCVAGFAASEPAAREELLRLDGASPGFRLIDRLRRDGRGLALGALVVFVAVMGSTTSFDLAQIVTFGYELRVLDSDLDAGPRSILVGSLPAVALAVPAVILVWRLLGPARVEPADRGRPVAAGAVAATATIWTASAAVPFLLFARNLGAGADVSTFMGLYGGDVARTCLVAVVTGALAGLVTVGLAAGWHDHRRWVRHLASAQAVGWIVAAFVPAMLLAAAIEAAWNRRGLDAVYASPAVLVLAYVARFAFVGALLARWVTRQEPSVQGDLRRLDGAGTLTGYVLATWPRLLAAGGAAGAVAAALALSELSVTARLQPPGFGVIATAVLNAMHYQRPDTVLLATLSLIAVGAIAAATAVLLWWPLRRSTARLVATIGLAGVVAATASCRAGDADEPRPLRTSATFGGGGRALGQFTYPRALAVDAARGVLYVVDKSARVQRYGFDGEPQHQWRMPAWDNGKPTGIAVHPDGRVLVADTHYHRVIAYDAQGVERMRFGEYGDGPGQFIYPTDVAVGPERRFYVSEYGGNDRVSVFDAEGAFLFEFGTPGVEPGQFNRPQALAFSRDGTELFIADACNHRIVVTDAGGSLRRVLGGPGRGPGAFNYPYDVAVLDDGTLLVCEFGNNRIQRLTAAGESLGVWGRVGAGEGELRYPWAADGDRERIFVLDSGNNRVQVVPRSKI